MTSDCAFCSIAAGKTPAFVVLDEAETLAFLDIRPLFAGHTLVVPRPHYNTVLDVPAPDLGAFFESVQRVCSAVRQAAGSEGIFIGANNVVSQSVPHLHVHVVPRNKGDGLKGFFWPRTKYADDAEAEAMARTIREALGR